eukprot:359108-Chlamydomonas_euryale.AAC.3
MSFRFACCYFGLVDLALHNLHSPCPRPQDVRVQMDGWMFGSSADGRQPTLSASLNRPSSAPFAHSSTLPPACNATAAPDAAAAGGSFAAGAQGRPRVRTVLRPHRPPHGCCWPTCPAVSAVAQLGKERPFLPTSSGPARARPRVWSPRRPADGRPRQIPEYRRKLRSRRNGR